MATLRDVASRAEVSVSTASRILSNSSKEKYAEATHVKVLRASLELGYRPNFAARALVSGKSNIIAVVFPRIYDTPFTALASLQILTGIEAYCSQNDYHLLLSSPRVIDGKVDSNFTHLLAGGYPDGLILDGHFCIDAVMDILQQYDLPTVMLGYQPHSHYLRSDNFLGGRLLMEHLLDFGHRHIGIIGMPDRVSLAADERLRGIRQVGEERGLNIEVFPRVNGSFSLESGAVAARDLLLLNSDLTAIIALNDRMAMGAVRQLREAGYRVPEDVSVVGYDDLPQSREFDPPLTTINQQLGAWGEIAMAMMQRMLAGETPESIVLPPQIIIRQSTALPCKLPA